MTEHRMEYDIVKLAIENGKLKEQIEGLLEAIDCGDKQIMSVHSQMKELQIKNERLLVDNYNKKKFIKEILMDNAGISRELRGVSEEIDRLNKENTNLRTKNDALRQELRDIMVKHPEYIHKRLFTPYEDKIYIADYEVE